MNNRELDFLDIISLASFMISVKNLDLNVSQEDLSTKANEISEELHTLLGEIHEHLSVQDAKINIILNRLEDLYGSK